jgi:hypothetical protein
MSIRVARSLLAEAIDEVEKSLKAAEEAGDPDEGDVLDILESVGKAVDQIDDYLEKKVGH